MAPPRASSSSAAAALSLMLLLAAVAGTTTVDGGRRKPAQAPAAGGEEEEEEARRGAGVRYATEEGAHVKAAPPRRAPPAPAPAASPDQFRGQARLPRFAAPRRYDLRLRPDLVACTFTGSAAVTVAVSAPTRFLVLNAADLSVDRTSIRFRDLVPNDVVFFADDEILVLEFAKELPLGEGVLSMNFNGTLNDQMRGFYRSKYQYKGKTNNMAVTQFESVDARRCFPCWDEPAFKAKFKLTLEVPSELVALSNMPVAMKTVNGPMKTVQYGESPLMSTYLVAIVVGSFDYIESVTAEGTRVRVYTQVGKSNQGKFALDVGVKSLHLYKDYFGTPYPLPKLDMVAIPDFAAGAMENYGLVTFREVALLFDELSSSESSKQNVAITVAHELAHQWFGNLVTMEWWTHLWLNEDAGFWFILLTVSLFPQVEIHHASEVDEIFDAISYDKGASVIRMLQNYLGAERFQFALSFFPTFQKALASYIRKYAYSNARTEDLWAVLEEKSGEPVKNLMTTWTKQQGYPVINAKLKGTYLEIEQAQFLLDGSSGPGMWIVPITLAAYLSVMQNVTSSNRSGYNDLLKVYRESAEAEEKTRVLGTLCYCKDKNIVLESLNFLFSNEVRNQDAYYVLQGLGVDTRDTAWIWLKGNWDRISKKFGDTQVTGFIRYVVTLFSSNEKAAEFSRFFSTRKKPTFERTLKQSLETVRINARWIQCIRSEPRLAQMVRDLLQNP
ncbi:hypothetical protein PR202_ga16040 [Eleusine coracana subsp. coracana]|uniref:Aminopeptidase n=1 Tax=Eleusine coracana subsp. coracana TaxID=191504 RepID=A0AAV5CL55_ELECO|nr:hypothetical protein PR202_ga16040 [Eleusine coracana subsp. coracana]